LKPPSTLSDVTDDHRPLALARNNAVAAISFGCTARSITIRDGAERDCPAIDVVEWPTSVAPGSIAAMV
jgi:hypothetical protein